MGVRDVLVAGTNSLRNAISNGPKDQSAGLAEA